VTVQRATRRDFLITAAGALAAASLRAQDPVPRPAADHHQHLFGPLTQSLAPTTPRLDADGLVRLLDAAGIGRAVVLSTAYQFGNPNRPPVEDEYAKVRAENDWTALQVARHSDRLIGFCGVNPLKDYAEEEIRRCAGEPSLRTGLKLHFGNSDVQLDDPEHVAKVKAVFARANAVGMAIAVHLHGSVNRQRPHGARQATTFLEQLLPAAPDIVVQIAHLTSAGGWERQVDEAMDVLAQAIRRSDARTRRLYFDISGVGLPEWEKHVSAVAACIRQVGTDRMLFGSDGTADFMRPVEAWEACRQLPLTVQEASAIAANVAPYLHA
jgi:predicted TIM-barrel fold metal-dependent hydrolase